MPDACSRVSLGALGALRVAGADARGFLQGQLSNDLTRLSAERSLLAGYHNPQGRVIALLRLVQLAPEEVLALMPRELVTTVAQRLRKFVLRAQVTLADESALWSVSGLLGIAGGCADAVPWAVALPSGADRAAQIEGSIAVSLGATAQRWLIVSPSGQPALGQGLPQSAPREWQRIAIACGEPQVYAATSEHFVAQMLNLDVLGAIDFDKGCYTGQEVIARAHYRGRVKRRLQRFLTRSPARLAAGDAGVLGDDRPLEVVEAVERADGRCEFLAVTALGGTSGELPTPASGSAALDVEPLPLPYALPQ